MINLELTFLGRSFVGENRPLAFPSFVASSSFDIEDMEAYLGGSYSGTAKFIKFDVAYVRVLPYGEIYNVGYQSLMRESSEVFIGGLLDLSDATSKFEVNSLALCCCDKNRISDDPRSWMIFAFGELELNSYPLPVQPDDSMYYAFPFKFNYGTNIPDLLIPEGKTPWKTFLDHCNNTVENLKQTHNVWFDLQNLKVQVGNTTLDLPVSSGGSGDIEERIANLQREIASAVKYRPLEGTDNSYIAAVDKDQNCVLNSFVKRGTIASTIPKTSLDPLTQSLFQFFNNFNNQSSIVQINYQYRVHWSVNEQTWTQGMPGSFSSADFIFIIPCSTGWFTSRMTYTINRSQNNCYFVRGDASQEAWTSYFYVAIWRTEVIDVPGNVIVV